MVRTDALRVLALLTAAYPSQPMPEETVELYVSTLIGRTPDVGIAFAVAQDWIGSQLYFPKVAEFVESYGQEVFAREKAVRQRQRSQDGYRAGTVACTSCEDRGTEIWEANGETWSAPCESCRPEERAYWREGHYDANHDVRGCPHPRCVDRSRKRGRARA